jgi:predicted DCC family thiol-disulfide oxidoreductase YuxK
VTSWRPQPISGVSDQTVLFDGVCVLCSRWARFVIDRDPAASFRFVTVQEPFGRVLAAQLGIDTEAPETNAVILAGRAYFKSDAAIEVLSRLPGWWWVRLGLAVPRPWRDGAYDILARNRYRWFGRSQECVLPTPETTRHFLSHTPPS